MADRRIDYIALDQIVEWDENPKDHDIPALIGSIRRFGFQAPPLLNDQTGVLLAGHGRLHALAQMQAAGEATPDGIGELNGQWLVPVVRGSQLEMQEAVAYSLADNRLVELGGWDEENLAGLMVELEADDALEGTGWSPEDLDELLRELGKDTDAQEETFDVEAALETEIEPRIKRGEVWQLGDHRLMCGDSTSKEDVVRLMKGERAILFATDPPYGVGYDQLDRPEKGGKALPAVPVDPGRPYTDWVDAEEAEPFYDGFVQVAIEAALQKNAAWYCWHGCRNQTMVENVWLRHGAFVHQQIVWVKDRPLPTRCHYMWRHENCFFGWIKGHRPPRRAHDNPHTVWEIPTSRAGEKTPHPTMKPLELFRIPIMQHTVRGELCYEPFAGSGSQINAGEQLGRRVYAMEIAAEYCEVAIRRWEDFTGHKAVRVDG